MTSWFVLAAFGSALAWSGLDVARKSLSKDVGLAVIAAALLGGLTLLFGVWSLLTAPSIVLADYIVPASVSTALSLAVNLSILASMRAGEFSRTIPMLSMTPVATSLFGVAVLGEQPSTQQWIGILLVFVGALGLGLSRHPLGHPEAGGLRFHFDKGVLFMLVAALCISAAAPFDKLALTASASSLHGFVQSLVTMIVMVVYLGWRGDLRGLAGALRRRPLLSLAALIAFAALALQFVAYGGVMVGVVETIKRVVGLAMSVVAGRLIFGEPVTPKKVVTVGVMAAGVALLLI